MNNVKTFNEGSLILVLLSLTLFFNFWVVPFGVADPENFGYEDGLAPSFAVYLVGILALVTLMYQFIKVFIFKINKVTNSNTKLNSFEVLSITRSKKIISSCLIYSFLLVPNIGFYFGSIIFIITLSVLMGERRVSILTVVPLIVMLFIFLGFEKGFQIFLPEDIFFKNIFRKLN
tara:strand:+ start:967 stop:1491 length:525 start_codon:yes stop_codon:yes gene_type:complete